MDTPDRRAFLAASAVAGLTAALGGSDGAIAQEDESAGISPNPEALQQFLSAPDEGPFVMLNLLKFKPDGGQAEYMAYGMKVQPLLEEAGATSVYVGSCTAGLVSDETWDMIALVMYPSKAAFLGMVNSEAYQAIHHHRAAGLAKTVLYATKPMGEL